MSCRCLPQRRRRRLSLVHGNQNSARESHDVIQLEERWISTEFNSSESWARGRLSLRFTEDVYTFILFIIISYNTIRFCKELHQKSAWASQKGYATSPLHNPGQSSPDE